MERIEGIKILHVDGLGGGGGGGGARGQDAAASFADSVVNSALRYRAQAPLVDQLLREIGIEGGEIGKLAQPAWPRLLPVGRAGGQQRDSSVYTSSVIDASADSVWARDPRLQRAAAVASAHRRQAHRERAGRPTRSAASATSTWSTAASSASSC